MERAGDELRREGVSLFLPGGLLESQYVLQAFHGLCVGTLEEGEGVEKCERYR